jgi:hypothetical protein
VMLDEICCLSASLDVCGTMDSFSADLTGFAGRERFSVKTVLNDVHDE